MMKEASTLRLHNNSDSKVFLKQNVFYYYKKLPLENIIFYHSKFLGRHRYGRPHNFLNDARRMPGG